MDVTIQIVILAMIAAFLGLRLYSVLGRRAEHEEEPIRGRFEEKAPQPGAPPVTAPRLITSQPAADQARETNEFEPGIERGLRAIATADRRFELPPFMEGARGAYRMVLEAFWRSDKEELAQLCDSDVFEGFSAAIDARAAAGETLDNRLVRINEMTITNATFQAPMARISVQFAADIAAVTRDKDGNLIAGSLNDAVDSQDVWTFSRDVTSSDPNWLLDETDEG